MATFIEQRRRAKITKWDQRLPNVTRSTSIPKIIHQTLKSRAALVPKLAAAVEHTRKLNPNWNYTFYDDTACKLLISRYYGKEILNLYERINPNYGAARADLFRYLVVYFFGGVYADIKTKFERPFDETLRYDDTFIVSQWDNGRFGTHPGFGRHADLLRYGGDEIQQWFIVSARGHPFLRAVICRVLANIEIYNRFVIGVGRNGVLRTTGPIAYTEAIAPLLESEKFRLVNNALEIGLSYSIGENYDHRAALPGHYTEQSTSVVL